MIPNHFLPCVVRPAGGFGLPGLRGFDLRLRDTTLLGIQGTLQRGFGGAHALARRRGFTHGFLWKVKKTYIYIYIHIIGICICIYVHI